MANGKVDWYGDEVLVKLGKAMEGMLDQAALLIEAQTKININSNGQVDTGFMQNSVYVVTPRTDSYGAAQASGTYHSRAEGRNVEREIAPKVSAGEDEAAIVVGAGYAIYQEERIPFLYPAVEQVAGQMQGEIITRGREEL